MTKHARLGALGLGGIAACVAGMAGTANAQPVNDDCEDAIQIVQGQVVGGSTTGATQSGDITTCAAQDTIDVWYSITPSNSEWIEVSTCGPGGDSSLAVFDSCAGAELACNDNGCGAQALLNFFADAGETYLIRVSHPFNGAGIFRLTTSEGVEPPNGPDCVYTECVSVTNWGVVGGVRGYSLASHTCNIGDAPMYWGFSHDESPVLAMNAYRYSTGDGFKQIGMSWAKTACCAADGDGCGLGCDPDGFDVLGPGCRDVYSASYNGGHSRLAPRSSFNAWIGTVTPAPGGGGNAIYKRLQVAESDMSVAGALYFVEGVYVASDDAPVGNHYNNASYKQVTVSGPFNLNPTGSMNVGMPAVYAWQDADPAVEIVEVDVPGEGRFFVGGRASQNLDNSWTYRYCVYNLNSDRSGASLEIPIADSANVSAIEFHDTDYHSGEVYDNADWDGTKDGPVIRWETTTPYTIDPNGNALRWATMYTFSFTTDVAPAAMPVQAKLGLFNPGVPDSVMFEIVGPEGDLGCAADWNMDGFLNDTDFFDWVNDFFSASGPQGQSDFNEDTFEDAQDWFDFVNAFFAPEPGCNI